MKRQETIARYFDRSSQLTVKSDSYVKSFFRLFDWFILSDGALNDITTIAIQSLVSNKVQKAKIVANEPGIIAGVEEVVHYFSKKNLVFTLLKNDGDKIINGETICELSGNFADIMKYERTILNVLQRMSGIATVTDKLIKKARRTAIAATRKTQWGLLDKKAVSVGGGLTHRLSLSDGFLIKDNHIDLVMKTKSISQKKTLELILQSVKMKELIEIEVDTHKDAVLVSDFWNKLSIDKPLIIMLDNFSTADAKKTVIRIKKNNVIIELSGGINEANIAQYARVGADVISLGVLTHSAKTLDLYLQIP